MLPKKEKMPCDFCGDSFILNPWPQEMQQITAACEKTEMEG